jgi:hypothetical protein
MQQNNKEWRRCINQNCIAFNVWLRRNQTLKETHERLQLSRKKQSDWEQKQEYRAEQRYLSAVRAHISMYEEWLKDDE